MAVFRGGIPKSLGRVCSQPGWITLFCRNFASLGIIWVRKGSQGPACTQRGILCMDVETFVGRGEWLRSDAIGSLESLRAGIEFGGNSKKLGGCSFEVE
ncbi:hypothetical protein K0M31_009139, partial [Melipona bicolor]